MRLDLGAAAIACEEMYDPAIKLFGMTIALLDGSSGEGPDLDPAPVVVEVEKDICININSSETKDPASDSPEELDQSKQDASSDSDNGNVQDDKQSNQLDKVDENPKAGRGQGETDFSGQEKVLKKPDKILPCPRCNSKDTKFCYYNNYNVNQPRHFCKKCHRYWTAGGTMRNVPVGAGRRKNKHSATHQHNMVMLSDEVAATRADSSDSTHQTLSSGLSASMMALKVNGTVLKFGPEAPLSESMASVLNPGDQKRNSEPSYAACSDNIDEPSCSSSVTAPSCVGKEVLEIPVSLSQSSMQGSHGINPSQHFLFYPWPAWAYPWSPGWNNVAAMAAGQCLDELGSGSDNVCPNPVTCNPHPMIAAPAFSTSGIPFPFIPPLWGCVPNSTYGAWNMPSIGSYSCVSQSSSTADSGSSGNGSPTLGKHSRDASFHNEEKTEKSLWVPKTLRIDDPDEAAKSSIWATLGIKPDEGGIFKAFQSKVESKSQLSDATQVFHANPAALSRSQTFHENT